jgi:hypothetical protein
MSVIHTKEWHAVEDSMPPGGATLRVTGQVETTNSNQTPHLSETNPQGIVPNILLLDLTVTASGAGEAVMGWQEARFEKKVSRGQYKHVDILWEGKIIQHLDVMPLS